MASNTENLDLLMKNPSTDGADTFNVQTMLNDNWQKIDNNAGTVAQTLANILKPTTPPLIGLPPSTTPDGMFQALGNTGELHVWRKTVVVGSYYIGATQGNYGCICRNTGSASFGVKIQYASEITVDSHENRNLVSPSDMTIIANNSGITSPSATSVENTLKGKFIRLAGIPDGYQNSELKYAVGSVFYCPESISCFVKDAFNDGDHYICLDGIKNVPTKTENVVTYPVSTNPNAYQEGDDAKEAGYTLGEVIKSTGAYGFFGMMGFAYGTSYFQKISDAIEVADDGSVSHVAPVDDISDSTVLDSASVLKERIAGKYITLSENSYTKQPYTNELPPTNTVLYIPADVNVKMIHPEGDFLSNQYALFFDRYQPVTGYAAIPAGTTIEYLGKLGDKARVQVLSYVGTGTYGADNPCSLTFDFAPMFILIAGSDSFAMCIGDSVVTCYRMLYSNFPQNITTRSNRGRTISFYQTTPDYGEIAQCNSSGVTYNVIAIS